MPKKQRKRGGGAKKIGRALVKCARYRANKTRERNKLRKLRKQPQSPFVAQRIRELEDYISGKTETDKGRKGRKKRHSRGNKRVGQTSSDEDSLREAW